jgi:hypothetical protein
MQTRATRRLQFAPFPKRAGALSAPALCALVCLAIFTSSLRAQEPAPPAQGPSLSDPLPEAPQPQLLAPQQQHPTPATPDTRCHISGVVSDIQGGLIPGAHILAERAGANPFESQETTASNLGHFRFSDLPAGTYSITITAPGFENYRLANIVLKPGESYSLPEVALPIARTSADATVTITEEQLAEVELNDQLHQRVLGILPNYYTSYIWDAAPLTMRQKFKLAIRSATDPVFFATTGISAGISLARNDDPEYGTGVSGYFERYGSDYGGALVGRVVTSVLLNSLFHEDPRYFVMTNGSILARSWHAVSSTFMQRGDDLRFHPAYANFIGSATTAVIVSSWDQGSTTSVGQRVLNDTVLDLGSEAIRNLAREFLFRHLARHVPTYAKGRPPDENDGHTKHKPAPPVQPSEPAQPSGTPQP